MIKKRGFLALFSVILISCLLSGCAVRDSFKNALEAKYKTELELNDPRYVEYEKNKESGKLDNENHYKDDGGELVTGQIEISFFSNNHLDTKYYYDEERTELVNPNNCFLNPGDSLYADYPKVVNQSNSKYEFSAFLIYSYIGDTQKEQFTSCNTDGKILTIPESFTGNHLSIMAIGEYKDRILNFTAHAYRNQELVELNNGQWKVNNETYNNLQVTINSSKPYKVKYDYSQYVGDYYFYESSPKPFNYNDLEGIVEFESEEVNSTCDNYSVILKPYKKLIVDNKTTSLFSPNGHIRLLLINGEEVADITKSKIEYKKLKPQDKIVVRLDKGYRAVANNLENSKPVYSDDYTEYSFFVTDSDQLDLYINCEEDDAKSGAYEPAYINNGTIDIYFANNQLVKAGEIIDDSEKVTVKIVPNYGYYVTGKNVENNLYIKTMKYKDYVSDKDDIVKNHEIKKYVTVTFDTSDKFGSVTYNYSGKDIIGETKLKEGDTVKCSYTIENSKYAFKGLPSFIKEKTVKINIKSNMNGQIIKASDYIELKEK